MNIFNIILVGLTELLGGMVPADNATNNDMALKALGGIIDPNKIRWDPVS
jgi:hypothetical protein